MKLCWISFVALQNVTLKSMTKSRVIDECGIDRTILWTIGSLRVDHCTEDAQELVGNVVEDQSPTLAFGLFAQEIGAEALLMRSQRQ